MKTNAVEMKCSAPPLGWRELIDSRISTLTLGEVAVLMELRNGLADKQIASRLGISIRTVRFHAANASKKLFNRSCSRIESALWSDRNLWPPGLLSQIVRQLPA